MSQHLARSDANRLEFLDCVRLMSLVMLPLPRMRLTSGVSIGCKHVDAALCDPIKVKTPIGLLSLLYATAAAA